MDIPNIYGDPILTRKRRGSAIDPYKKVKETIMIETHYALLTEIPNRHDKVRVTGLNQNFYETEDEFLEENMFRVDYTNGIVYFHGSLKGKTLHFEYTGEGVYLFPDSRVYYTGSNEFPNLRDKIIDVDREILVQKNRVDELIRSVPQPSEIVDMRVDRNGKIYSVVRDRLDAEQKIVEDAYEDANGIKYGSLKERIDSLQKSTEESFDEQEIINTSIWAEIELIPGMISLETGKLEEKINGEITKLTSKIDLIPEQIQLSVRELREYSDGRFTEQSSTLTMLSNQMELKVDVDGVVSSINLSKEGVAIAGDKVRITGETHIENGVITSAKIKDLNADKIKAGIIRAQNNNSFWNLDTGEFAINNNTDMTLGGGAKIRFTDSGNRIVYTQIDPQTNTNYTAGFGVGKNINRRFPFSYFGANRGNTVNAMDSTDFTGFIANTDARTDVDNIGNSVVGEVFHIRDKAVSFREGFRFDLRDGIVNVFRPINTHLAPYDIGNPISRFRNVYTDNVRSNGTINLRDSSKTSGWLIQTRYANDGSAITLRGLNGGSYNYSIGGRNGHWERITTIRLKNKPNVSSDARLKEDISALGLGLDFITMLEPATFRFKQNATGGKNKLEFGFIAQQIKHVLDKHKISIEHYSILSQDEDGMYALEHEQFIAPIVNSIKELNDKDTDKEKRIRELEAKVKNLEEQLASA